MPNTTKSNKLKRKRGKKFVWRGSRDVRENQDSSGRPDRNQDSSNPFEEHEKTQRVRRDLEKRQELLNDYRRLNKNSVIKDNRLGETSSKLSEEDKMKLRYMREQRERARQMLDDKDREIEERKDKGDANHVAFK